MPSIRLSPFVLRAPVSRSIGASRTFYASAPRSISKESELNNRSPEEAEALKQQQLKEQKDGKGKWHEGLASDSESAVKADRGDQAHSEKSIDQLQKETAKAAQKEQK